MLLHLTEHTQESADRLRCPVLILHGMFGAGDNWTSIARNVGQTRRVWTVDLPGHGNSFDAQNPARSERIFEYPAMAARLAETLVDLQSGMDPHAANQFIMCGHSMGGKVAMALSLLYPQLVSALAVIDISPIAYDGQRFHGPEIKMLSEFDPDTLKSRLDADMQLKRWIPNELVRGFLAKNLRPSDSGGFFWRFDAQAILNDGYRDITDWPNSFTASDSLSFGGPTLFIRGDRSDYIVPDRDFSGIHALFPYAQIQDIEDAGHWVHVDNKDAFMKHLQTFLSNLP